MTFGKDPRRVRGLRGALVQDGKWEIVVRTITSVVDLGVPAQEVTESDVVSDVAHVSRHDSEGKATLTCGRSKSTSGRWSR